MKKNDIIVMRVENALKEFLVSEAIKRDQSLSGLLRFLIKRYFRDKYKPEKASKGV